MDYVDKLSADQMRKELERLQREYGSVLNKLIAANNEIEALRQAAVSGSLPLALMFHHWMINKGWTKHSSGEYYYRSKDFHQWPPDETATEDELLKMFGGNDR